ncbi:MAG: DUF4145 domain-containing protein [Deltaproteobacteria bacterium]|jgi:hypothetical protein|nr:DUF4145 domain-containing protein [Deltaproteobacteria bacterium]
MNNNQINKQEIGCCNKCKESFKCDILFSFSRNIEHVDYEYSLSRTYFILKCPNCTNIFFKRLSEFITTDTNDDGTYVDIYPQQANELREIIHNICVMLVKNGHRKWALIQLLHELNNALDNRAYMLASMGIRTSIDMICRKLIGINGYSFKQNIEKCRTNGFLSQSQLDILKPVIELGHGSVHRDYKPDESEVKIAMKVVLNLIETHIIHANVIKSVLRKHLRENSIPFKTITDRKVVKNSELSTPAPKAIPQN